MLEAILVLIPLFLLWAAALALTRAWWQRRPRPWRRAVVVFLTLLLVLGALLGTWKLSNSRQLQLFQAPLTRVDTTEKVVALTFDDGPSPQYTDEILAILARYRAPATFFVTGRELAQAPEEAARIAAAGHELGNHSFSHQPMVLRPMSWIRSEVEETDALIRRAGYQGPISFRPPYCKKLVLLPYYLHQTGRTTVVWDVEPESYPGVAADADRIVEHVLAEVRPGSIVLLHLMYEGRAVSRQALPGIIEGLQAQGYRLVTVAELESYSQSSSR